MRIYSAGMALKSGFAVAIIVNPDILTRDQILTVSKENSQSNCMDRFEDMMPAGTWFVFMSHDFDTVGTFCNSAIWVHE